MFLGRTSPIGDPSSVSLALYPCYKGSLAPAPALIFDWLMLISWKGLVSGLRPGVVHCARPERRAGWVAGSTSGSHVNASSGPKLGAWFSLSLRFKLKS